MKRSEVRVWVLGIAPDPSQDDPTAGLIRFGVPASPAVALEIRTDQTFAIDDLLHGESPAVPLLGLRLEEMIVRNGGRMTEMLIAEVNVGLWHGFLRVFWPSGEPEEIEMEFDYAMIFACRLRLPIVVDSWEFIRDAIFSEPPQDLLASTL